ncbi:MAG: ABC transporter permease [Erysipelotrichaceae bacterium]|nr:ABC transporter permease [Erysipelotrichaceae bacterium]
MFVRNGINSVLRERGRTTLFSLLIVSLTIAMMLSLGVLLYCDAMMNACEEGYRSIALVEYMGSEYPDEDEPDAIARQASQLLKDEDILSVSGVRAWNRGNTAAGLVEGYERRSGAIPYGNLGVIVVSRVSDPVYQWYQRDEYGDPDTSGDSFFYYTCILETSLYSRNIREGVLIDLLPGDSGFLPEKGKRYVLNGLFPDTTRSGQQIGDYPMNGLTIFRIESFFEADDQPYAECPGNEEIPAIFLQEAEHYRAMNNYVRVVPCRDVNDVQAFQQDDLQLAQGAMPEPGSENHCVISADMAESLQLSVGDSFTLQMQRSAESDRYYLTVTDETSTLTVSGIAADSLNYYGTVWVIAEDAQTPLFGYLLGTASLINSQGEEAVETLQAMMPQLVRVSLLDQGYNSAVQPFRQVRKTALNVLVICCAGMTAVLLLFAFLFIGRQSDTVRIMVSLGTPGRKIALWFLSGALLICGCSAAVGTLAGTLLRPAVIALVSWLTSSAGSDDFLWYSETSRGMVKQMTFDISIPIWPNLAAALGIIALALLFCLLFLRLASRSWLRKKGKSRVRVPHGRTSRHGRGGLRFAMLSIRRGGLRSLLVPLVSMVLTVTVITLSGMYQGWQSELEKAMDRLHVDGMVVSLNGTYYSNLALSITDVRKLQNTEGITDVAVSFGYPYWLEEEMPAFGNGESGRWRREVWIASQPEMVALNDLDAAKDFYYAEPNTQWLEGWDEATLTETLIKPLILRNPALPESDVIPAVCSASFLEDHGMALGDTLVCNIQYERYSGYPLETTVVIQAVGSYVQSGGKAHIYVPLSLYIPTATLTEGIFPEEVRPAGVSDEQVGQFFGRMTFRTCRFHLTSARELEDIRQRLMDQGFSSVRHISANRTTLLLRDAAFLKLRENMDRNIAVGRIMSAMISLLIVLLGFILSWLMTFSRRPEFALMRGFGASKHRVFASFFLEQAILSLVGCLAGCAALIPLYAGGIIQPLTVAAYLICYLLGTAVSIKIIGKTDLMELLTVRE